MTESLILILTSTGLLAYCILSTHGDLNPTDSLYWHVSHEYTETQSCHNNTSNRITWMQNRMT